MFFESNYAIAYDYTRNEIYKYLCLLRDNKPFSSFTNLGPFNSKTYNKLLSISIDKRKLYDFKLYERKIIKEV